MQQVGSNVALLICSAVLNVVRIGSAVVIDQGILIRVLMSSDRGLEISEAILFGTQQPRNIFGVVKRDDRVVQSNTRALEDLFEMRFGISPADTRRINVEGQRAGGQTNRSEMRFGVVESG